MKHLAVAQLKLHPEVTMYINHTELLQHLDSQTNPNLQDFLAGKPAEFADQLVPVALQVAFQRILSQFTFVFSLTQGCYFLRHTVGIFCDKQQLIFVKRLHP